MAKKKLAVGDPLGLIVIVDLLENEVYITTNLAAFQDEFGLDEESTLVGKLKEHAEYTYARVKPLSRVNRRLLVYKPEYIGLANAAAARAEAVIRDFAPRIHELAKAMKEDVIDADMVLEFEDALECNLHEASDEEIVHAFVYLVETTADRWVKEEWNQAFPGLFDLA